MATPSTDVDELAKFGYKQELDRSLGLFSSFAAGFSYISIMTGVFELFFFGYLSGGPAMIWTWPAVFVGQFLVALCFAELAGQYPLAGSVYQWSKQIAKPFTSFFGGWILTVGSIVTLAAVAVAYQIVAPQISSVFEIIGGPSDVGLVSTPGGAKNALLLAAALVVFTTVINMLGVKTMARINNFGVFAELVGVTLLIILLAAHIRRGPGVIFDTFGLGKGYPFGYFGAFLVAGLMSAYVMYGFDTAGSLAEETLDPRKNAPPAILRALAAAGLAGFLVILFGEMSVPNIHASQLGTSGLPYLVKATLGTTIGDLFLIISLIAITVCSLAVHAGGIRMIFTMGRDNRLPYASAIAKVHGKSKTPLVPSIVIGVITILLLVLNVGNQRAFFVLTSVAIIMFYIAYLCVTGPLLIARLRGKWPTPEHGPYFNMGRWGLVVNVLAVIFQIVVMVNLAWPRPAVYGADHWYFQWGAFTFTGVIGLVGVVYYLAKLRGRPATVLAEHHAEPRPPWPPSATSPPEPDPDVQDVAGFLGSHPPFDAVDAGELARIAAITETEVSPRGKAIFPQGAGPVEHVWVVRSGSVEVIHDGRVLDLLGPGELFGHASMISGLPTGFEARAAEDTVCYRIPADVIRPLLAHPDVLRFVARSIVARAVPAVSAEPVSDPVQSQVATLIRTPPLLCQGSEPIREAARRMTDQGASAVLVPLADSFGIVTDRDLRSTGDRRGPQPGRTGLGDHDRARLHRDRRPARRRRPARHARAQRAPHPGAVAGRAGPGRGRRRRPGRRRGAQAAPAAARHRAGGQPGGAGRRGGRAEPGDHRAARRAGDGRAPDRGSFGRAGRADPAAGRAGRPGRRAAARAVHLVRAGQPGPAGSGAVLRRGQRAGLGRETTPRRPVTWGG